MSTHDHEWLVSEAARPWLELAAACQGATLQLASRLRKDLTVERARLVVQQAELRRRATEKFILADRMFFTPIGLQQSTDQWIAAYKAGRLAEWVASGGELADLCCGIGGDLLAGNADEDLLIEGTTSYDSNYLRPTVISGPRTARFGVRFEF